MSSPFANVRARGQVRNQLTGQLVPNSHQILQLLEYYADLFHHGISIMMWEFHMAVLYITKGWAMHGHGHGLGRHIEIMPADGRKL